jgi:flagellar assembly protein FliH
MLKAVFRQNELVTLTDKVVINSPTTMELSHMAPVEEIEEIPDAVEEYKGPTADDLRREAEMFKSHWEEEKQRMMSSAQAEADGIVQNARDAAFQEVKRQTDEAQAMKQQAEMEAENIIQAAKVKAADAEREVRQTLDGLSKEARDKGREDGKTEGFADGKAEVERLIERTQTVLERAQDKRAEILSETEQEIVDLVLLIARKVIKVIADNQRDIIVPNIVEALRKVKAKGSILIRVNLADLQLATENKEYFIRLMEGAKEIQVVEDSTVDPGGCIIETDFGEIDARISSQLAELESKILEISPIRSSIKGNLPPPVVRTANLNADLAASAEMLNEQALRATNALTNKNTEAKIPETNQAEEEDDSFTDDPAAKAALTASAALAALATMSVKGKRQSDKELLAGLRKTDKAPQPAQPSPQQAPPPQ